MTSSVVGDEVAAIVDEFDRVKFDRVKDYEVVTCPFICNPRIFEFEAGCIKCLLTWHLETRNALIKK